MPKLEQKDILIKLKKKNYLDGVDWVIWHNGFETSYPNVDSFFKGLKENLSKRLHEIDYSLTQKITEEKV